MPLTAEQVLEFAALMPELDRRDHARRAAEFEAWETEQARQAAAFEALSDGAYDA